MDFLSIPSGDGAKKAKRAEDIPGAASKCFSTLALLRGELFTEIGIDPLVDLGENVECGIEGFLNFLGAPEE